MWPEFRSPSLSPEAEMGVICREGPAWHTVRTPFVSKHMTTPLAPLTHGAFHSGCCSWPRMTQVVGFTASGGSIKGWLRRRKSSELPDPLKIAARAPLGAIFPFPCPQWVTRGPVRLGQSALMLDSKVNKAGPLWRGLDFSCLCFIPAHPSPGFYAWLDSSHGKRDSDVDSSSSILPKGVKTTWVFILAPDNTDLSTVKLHT